MPSIFNTAIQSIKAALQSLSHLNKSNFMSHKRKGDPSQASLFYHSVHTHEQQRWFWIIPAIRTYVEILCQYHKTFTILILAHWFQLWIAKSVTNMVRIQIIAYLKEVMEAIKAYLQSTTPNHLLNPNGKLVIYYLQRALFGFARTKPSTKKAYFQFRDAAKPQLITTIP